MTGRDSAIDFFISYNSSDRRWAEWVAWEVEHAGYSTVVQAWDFRPGANFVAEMDRALARAGRVLALLSPNYLRSSFAFSEWAAAFAKDPMGVGGRLVPIRIAECHPQGLLGQVVYIDLVELDEEAARKELLRGLEAGRAKPLAPVRFPDSPGQSHDAIENEPSRHPIDLFDAPSISRFYKTTGSAGSVSKDGRAPSFEEAPLRPIGGSTVESTSEQRAGTQTLPASEPLFKTLRVRTERCAAGQWRFTVKFVIVNLLDKSIAIDDLHTVVYEKWGKAPSTGASWIASAGEIWLMQDNSVHDQLRSRSIEPGNGCEMGVVLELSRLDRSPSPDGGRARAVFGLILDYYMLDERDIVRKSKTSDCIYVFNYAAQHDAGTIEAVNADSVESYTGTGPTFVQGSYGKRLRTYLEHHSLLRPVPKA